MIDSHSLPLVAFSSPSTVKSRVTHFYIRHGARLYDAPPSSDEFSSDVPSSFFIEDVLSSPPVEPSSSADSPSEQLIRCSHHLRQPLTITLIILSQSLLLLSQLLIEMLFFI
jgi:hypothetical protein